MSHTYHHVRGQNIGSCFKGQQIAVAMTFDTESI